MKKVLIVLALVSALSFAIDGIRVEGLAGTGTDDLLQYDDGTPKWIYSGTPYFGTWFDITDFMPGATSFTADFTEWWFYHHPNSPWDTDQILVELWEGDVAMPMTQLQVDDITALHYSATIVNYSTPIELGTDFWMVANTTVYSAAGVPAGLYDEFGNFTGEVHTFYSQDFILWDPLIPVSDAIDWFARIDGSLPLDNESWGAIKGLYR
jgi:hypothetical protein